MLEMEEIKHCVVIDKKRENGEKYLVCYYVLCKEAKEISNKTNRKYLMDKLPRYMVPNYYVKISKIPLSRTGKLNRKRLPEPVKGDFIIEEYVAPEMEVICKIYNEIFNIPLNDIGRMNDGLNAIRIISKIQKELKGRINVKDVMNNLTIVRLSVLIIKKE